jgi:beta-fructofuranosidase
MATDVLPRPPEKAPFVLTEKEPLKLRIFIDKSVVEVFVNDRQRVVARVNPSCKDALDVSLRSYGKPCLLKSLDAWQMRSIW